MWITVHLEDSSRDGIADHLTCLLRNLYGGQETTVRTGYGTTEKLGKEYIYVTYIVTLLL